MQAVPVVLAPGNVLKFLNALTCLNFILYRLPVSHMPTDKKGEAAASDPRNGPSELSRDWMRPSTSMSILTPTPAPMFFDRQRARVLLFRLSEGQFHDPKSRLTRKLILGYFSLAGSSCCSEEAPGTVHQNRLLLFRRNRDGNELRLERLLIKTFPFCRAQS